MDRRISALQLIQRIKQHEIDSYAARMNVIRSEQATLQAELEELQARLDREAHISSPEGAPYLAGFLRAIETRRAYLSAQLEELEHQAAEIEAQLMGTFTEARANDVVLEGSLREKRKQEDRQEFAAAEEIARNLFLRKRRAE